MFEFKINLNDDDYLFFNQYHFENSPGGRKALMSFRLVVPCISFMFICMFIVLELGLGLILLEASLLAVLSVFWIVYSKKLILKSMRNGIKKMKKSGKLPYSDEALMKFDDEHIYETTSDSESKREYSSLEKISVTDKAVYIFFSSVQAYILPMSVFSDEAQKHKFLEFISVKAGNLRNAK